MKRILMMAAHFHPFRGGLENFALDLSVRLAKKGHKVDVFTFNLDKNKTKENYKGITIHRFPGIPVFSKTWTIPDFTSQYKKMLDKVLSNNYDVVFTNTRFFPTSFLGYLYSNRIKKKHGKTKFIHIEHGNVHVIHDNPLITFFAYGYDQTLGRIIFSNADLVIGISKPCAEFAKKLGAKKTVVIHNSINTADFDIRTKTDRKKLGLKKNDFVIINSIGRLIYAKGLQDTFEAVTGLKNVVVVNIGEGPYEHELRKLAKLKKINAIFTGKLSAADVKKYLSAADLFVNPSYSEGLPTCVLEAGASGVPIVATQVGGTKEIITNNKEGLLVKSKNPSLLREKIIFMIKNKKKAREMGKKLRLKIQKKFDWNVNIDKFEKHL